MKKLFSVLAVGLLLLAYACGGGDDPKTLMNETADVLEDLINGLDKADNADDVVVAIEKAASAMEKLKPRIKAMEEKHPELKNMKPGTEFPEEYKDIQKRFEELMPKFMGVGVKLGKYMSDPKVQAASQKLDSIMK